MKAKTFGDAVKQVKTLFSTLGIGYWAVYFSNGYSILHGENSESKPSPGDYSKLHTALIVSDPIELFLDKEQFLFVLQDEME